MKKLDTRPSSIQILVFLGICANHTWKTPYPHIANTLLIIFKYPTDNLQTIYSTEDTLLTIFIYPALFSDNRLRGVGYKTKRLSIFRHFQIGYCAIWRDFQIRDFSTLRSASPPGNEACMYFIAPCWFLLFV